MEPMDLTLDKFSQDCSIETVRHRYMERKLVIRYKRIRGCA